MSEKHIAKKILISPLDWGLGHATRCIPLIHYLLFLKCEVTIAATSHSKKLLASEFPDLRFLNICAYNIIYSRKKRWLPLKILIQVPKILRTTRTEHKWLQELLNKEHFDAVISDNRYGLYSNKLPCIFITHQLQIRTSLNLLKKFMQGLNYKHINHFSEGWVPDFEGNQNLSGELGHSGKLPKIPVKYLGPLSRFDKTSNTKIEYKYLFMISGPEPQRTLLEQKVLAFAKSTKEKILIVLGKPGEERDTTQEHNYTIFNHLSTEKLSAAINASEFIVSRCGYTSVMEILALEKKSILIPTPGQTEQEYLAKHLMQQQWSYCFTQNEDFNANLQKAQSFNYILPQIDTNNYKSVLKIFVDSLK